MELKKLQGGKQVKKYFNGGVVGGAAQAALGIGQTIYGISTLRKANREMDSLLANAPQLTLPSAYEKYAETALSDTMLRRQTETINRNLASSASALGQAGGRALVGGLQSSVSGAQDAQLAAQVAKNQQAMQGLGVLGQAQSTLQGRQEERFKMQYGAADAAKQAALANIGSGLKATAMGATVGFGSYEGKGGDGSKQQGALDVVNQLWMSGSFKDGGKLKGKFSHEENPIHMVNENGEKVGEATGGEYILNPKQAAAISKESKYFRNLLKQKRFKK